MLELLVAIGILVLLLAIGVIGYRSIEGKSASDATRTMLSTAEGYVAEYESSAGAGRLIGPNGMFPANATRGAADVNSGTGRTTAIQDTQKVLALLAQSPNNKEAMGKLPGKSLITESNTANQPPAIGDGWRNPIIFVPPGGLTGVQIGRKSNGTFDRTLTVKAPNNRPFWASAGPDGKFNEGDDNVYSYEKK